VDDGTVGALGSMMADEPLARRLVVRLLKLRRLFDLTCLFGMLKNGCLW
jgi:hypothetical protein